MFWLVLGGMLLPIRMFAAFGLVDEGKAFVADSGAGLVFKVNAWSPSKYPQASSQPKSRSFTIGTYRGNNALFTYTIPASAFVAGTNTLTLTPVSGESDLGPWLSAGWTYDAIQLDAAPAMP